MAKLSPHEKLLDAMKAAARAAASNVSNHQLAEDFYKQNAALVDPLTSEIVLGYLANQLGYLRKKARRLMNKQLVFEEKLGFTHLPKTVTVDGERVPRGDASRKEFRKLISEARATNKASLEIIVEEVERGDALFARHSKRGKLELTWSEVVAKEAERAIQRGLFDLTDTDYSE